MTSAKAKGRDPAKPTREEGRLATRQRLLDAAVASLIEQGAARTTTLEVQRRAGASRGALLHHFPSHAELLSATVRELVRRNEEAVRSTLAQLPSDTDPVERAIQSLAAMMARPAFMAELELWAVARTDAALRAALRSAERDARSDSERVVRELFAPVADRPGYAGVVALSIEFLRGLSLSDMLRRSRSRRRQLIAQWIGAAKVLLNQEPEGPALAARQ